MHITAKIIQETSNKRLKTSKGEFISGEKKGFIPLLFIQSIDCLQTGVLERFPIALITIEVFSNSCTSNFLWTAQILHNTEILICVLGEFLISTPFVNMKTIIR